MVWHRTEVDGVPAYWAEGDEDQRRVYLAFRVGLADEQLAWRGITHLVEHLAMHAVGGPIHDSNGQVGAVTTVFAAHGADTGTADFVTGVCRALRALPFDRLERENQVLRTEAGTRGAALTDPLVIWRYGAATYGLPAYDELGVGRHTPDRIAAWAGRWFTRRNLVLVFAGGPPPADLTIDLPEGERMPPPEPSSALPGTPAYFRQPGGSVAMTSVVRRSTAAQVYSVLLRNRLHRSLRQEAALSYTPGTSYDARDGRYAHLTAYTDGLAENHDRLLSAFLHEIELLADHLTAPKEVSDVVTRVRAGRRKASATSRAYGNALRELLGAEPYTDAHLESDLDTVDTEVVQRTAVEVLDSAVVMVPGSRAPSARYRPAPRFSSGGVDGEALRSTNAPVDSSRLIVGADGVSLFRGPRPLTVRFRECEAMLAWPDGARRLIGRDGFLLTVEPTLWTRGASLTARLDAGVPADRVVPMPRRPAGEIPVARTSRYERVRARFKH
ncbi:peptidase M16 family protein [Actinoallomurus bryophytorum]|uniref:insulinase family protein n=1 Tax=Actinoallomurus bryophytorum TaxID=1490222 RepID=UPI00114F581B|nr:insulinase family protein [Actinoallomurus bryophytorum]